MNIWTSTLFFILLLSQPLLAQQEDKTNILPKGLRPSATRVTSFNAMYLEQHKEALAKFERPATLGMIEIPVQIHIVRSADRKNNVNVHDVHAAFDALNKYFMINYTRFVPLGDFNYIQETAYYDFDKTQEDDIGKAYDKKNVLNLYLVGSITEEGQKYCGYTLFPEEVKHQKNQIFITSSCLDNGVTLAREMAHYLTLYATHGTGNSKVGEFVSGENCLTEGDEICDTPADPEFVMSDIDDRCGYIGKQKDNSGRKRYYKPDTHNLMSDNPRLYCCNQFTTGQYKRMLYAAIHIRNELEFPPSGYSRKQLKQMALDKGIEGSVTVQMGNQAIKSELDGNLYHHKGAVYSEGDVYKITATTYKKGYVYILEGDREKGIYVKFPDLEKGDKAFSPNDEKMEVVVSPLKVDELAGEDGLNHIVVLFSRRQLEIDQLVREMNDIELDLDVIQRIYRVIGPDMIPTHYLDYSPTSQKVEGIAIDKFIAPVIIEYQQK